MVSQQKPRREWSRPQFIQPLGNLDLMDRGASCIPTFVRRKGDSGELLQTHPLDDPRSIDRNKWLNISDDALRFSRRVGGDAQSSIFYHALSVLHSPSYAIENADVLRQDWPRVPLPDSKERLMKSAELGRLVAALLDTENPVNHVTTGTIRTELKPLGVIARGGGSRLDPDAGDLDVTAGWGHAGKGGATMPGTGRWEERAYEEAEFAAMMSGTEALGLSVEQTLECLGRTTCDIYLNDRAYWKNVPIRVWEYTLGGYQVMKKWLSYREKKLLGRGLTQDEARYVTEMARRIAALLLLGPALDANYIAVKAATYAWRR